MLQITIPDTELWDEQKQEFINVKKQTLQLEHSLVSLSKWESKWRKAFLTKKEKNAEEILDYIRCMTLTQNVKPEVYKCLSNKHFTAIKDYIESPMTATVFSESTNTKGSSEVATSELIYYWMIALNIPFECQKWHINRLLTLIKVCSIKNSPPKKRSARELYSRNSALNAARRKQLNSRG